MTDPHFRISVDAAVIHVAFTRSAKYNAMSLEMLDALREATARLREDDSLHALLLTAEGKYFSAGIDLNGALAPDTDVPSAAAFRRWYRTSKGSLHSLGDEWEAIEKPIIVGFQGPVLGGALELALCADFRLASTGACFGLPEIALGGIPGSGGTSRLVRLAGPHWARWLVLANRQFDAERALTVGIVHDVLPADGFEASCLAFAHEMAALPPEAFAAGKIAIELAADLERAQARQVERLAVSSLVQGAEFSELMSAMQARLAGRKD